MSDVLYLDTSAIVKLYIGEPDTEAVMRAVAAATIVATSRVAWPETLAAVARVRREQRLDDAQAARVKEQFGADWRRFLVVELDAALARRAGELAEIHALRGFGALHLASALAVADHAGELPDFLAFGDRLNRAARACGMARGRNPGSDMGALPCAQPHVAKGTCPSRRSPRHCRRIRARRCSRGLQDAP